MPNVATCRCSENLCSLSCPFPAAATISRASSTGLLLWDQGSPLSTVKVAVCPLLWSPSRLLLLAAMQARGITVPGYDAIHVPKQEEAVPVQQFWAALCAAGGPDQVWHHKSVCARTQPGSQARKAPHGQPRIVDSCSIHLCRLCRVCAYFRFIRGGKPMLSLPAAICRGAVLCSFAKQYAAARQRLQPCGQKMRVSRSRGSQTSGCSCSSNSSLHSTRCQGWI